MVPEKIELPQIALQVLPADVVIDGDETTPNERMATFRSVNVTVGTHIFLCVMAHRLVFSRPALLDQRYAEYSSVIKRARLSTSSQIASLSVAAVTSATTRRRSCPFRSTAKNTGVLLVARP